MAIYIEGMKMPKSCWDCPFHDEDVCYPGDMSIDRGHHSDRSPYCPLTEVPPHGRLIDADEEIEVCTTQGAFPVSKTTVSKFLLGHCIGKIPPTVIPASGKEES